MLERIERGFARFIEPPGDASALALTLLGALQAFTTPTRRRRAWNCSERRCASSRRTASCATWSPWPSCASAAPRRSRSGVEAGPADAARGLAVDPNNGDLLANLQATYAWLAASPAATGARLGRWRPAWCGSMPTCAPGQAPMPLRSGWRSAAAGSISPVPTPAVIGCASTAAGAGRVRRGASRSGSRAFRTGMRQGHRAQLCAALRAGPQERRSFPRFPQLFRTLEGAQTGTVEAIPSRLAAAGLPQPRSAHALRKSSSCATRSASQLNRLARPP